MSKAVATAEHPRDGEEYYYCPSCDLATLFNSVCIHCLQPTKVFIWDELHDKWIEKRYPNK